MTTRLPISQCPYCGQRLDAASPADHSDAVPAPGDFTVCIICASPLVFDRKLRVRKPKPGEVPADCEGLDLVMRAVRSLDRRQ